MATIRVDPPWNEPPTDAEERLHEFLNRETANPNRGYLAGIGATPAPDLVTIPINLILELIEAARQNTGAEPSVSMFERAVDRVLEYHTPKRWPF